MKVCRIADTDQFKAVEKKVGLFKTVQYWRENNYTLASPEEVEDYMKAKEFEEEQKLASPLEGLTYLYPNVSANKEVYEYYNLLSKYGRLKVIPYKTDKEVKSVTSWIATLNKSPHYSFKLIDGVKGRKHIGIFVGKETSEISDLDIQPEKEPDRKDVRAYYFEGENQQRASFLLEKIADSDHPLNELAIHLLDYIKLNDVIVHLSKVPHFTNVDGIPKNKGYYSPSKNYIAVAEYNYHTRGYPHGFEKLMLHEIMHALTHKSLKKNNEYVREFRRLYDKATEELGKYDGSDATNYGTYSIDEFMAALFTDGNFIKRLKTIPALEPKKFNNLFQQIMNYLLDLLNLQKSDSLYEQAFSVASEIMNLDLTQMQERNSLRYNMTEEQVQKWLEEYGPEDEDYLSSFFIPENGPDDIYDILVNPISVDAEASKSNKGREIANKLIQKLSINLGIDASIISQADAEAMYKANNRVYNGSAGFFFDNQVYLVAEKMTTETVFHEFAHPIIRAISEKNPSLFNKLYEELANTIEGQKIINDVANVYSDTLSPDSKLFKEEVIVTALGRKADNVLRNTPETKGFFDFIKNMLYAIKQFFRKEVFKGNKIKIENLNVDTTLDGLAEMLANEDFRIETQSFTNSDIISESREFREEILDQLKGLESEDLKKMTKDLFNATKIVSNYLGTYNYKELREVLKDPMKRKDVQEILSNIQNYMDDTGLEFETTEEAVKYVTVQSANLLNSLYRLQSISEKMVAEYKRLSQNPDIKDNLSKIYYYNNVIKEWSIFLNQAKKALLQEVYDQKVSANNPLLNLINGISNTFEKTKTYSEKMLDGVNEILYDELDEMSSNIDEMYKDLIAFYEKKNAPKQVIDRYKYEYEQVKLSPEKIRMLIKGELGDAHPLNFFMESYMNNQDPVVFGFAKYVKNHYIQMNVEINTEMSLFRNGIEPLLDAAGYKSNKSRLNDMFRDLVVSDRKRRNKDGVDLSYYEFLNPYKDFYHERNILENKVREAQKKKEENNSDEAIKELAEAEAELDLFEITYMHQEKTPEFYKRFDLFKDEIGKRAYSRMRQKLNEIQGEQANLLDLEQNLDATEKLDILWREYGALSSLVYPDQTDKQGDELEIAKRIAEYKKQTKELYENKPRTGLFENKYINFLQSLIDSKIKKGSREYRQKEKEFLQNNTVVRFTDQFFIDTGKIFARLAELAEKDPSQKELSDLFEKRNNILSSFKDQNRHVVGSLMNDEQLTAILDIDTKISEFLEKSSSGLNISVGDWRAFSFYRDIVEEYERSGKQDNTGRKGLTKEQLSDFNRIKAKLRQSGKTIEEASRIMEKAKLIKELVNLQEREVTDDYIQKVNELMNEESRQFIKSKINTMTLSRTDIKFISNEVFLKEIFRLNPEFKEWFLKNHMQKTYKRKKGKSKNFYKPTSAWTYRSPKNKKYIQTTEIKDSEGNIIKTIYGVPKQAYWYRGVKAEYLTERITMLDCINRGIGIENATIDMQGRWLPRFGAGNNKFVNDAFFNLQRTSPEKYKLLMFLIKNHLEYQQKYVSLDSRLNLEIPRYEVDNLETITSKNEKGEEGNMLTRWAKQVKGLFTRTPGDFEEGLSMDQEKTLNKLDFYDEDESRIPITGTYDIEQNLVSRDIQRSMMRYMMSGVKQKVLTDLLPFAKALQAVVNDPDNNPDRLVDGVKSFSKQKLLTNTLFNTGSPKAAAIRAQAINAFIEREFEGQMEAGYTKNLSIFGADVNKIVNKLFGFSSFSFFAFNIPSAIKNSVGVQWQSMIEAAGGGYYNYADYLKGSAWASKLTFELASNSYGTKKSLDAQLVDMMDAIQGRVAKEVKRGTGINRSVENDIANLEFATSIRRMTELNASLSVFGAMLKKTLIERTMPDGTVQKISYDQAWELIDGVIQLKSGIDKSWDKGGKKYKSFVSKVHGVINSLGGGMAEFDKPNGNRFILMRWFMFLKSYFMPQLMARFEFKWDKKRKLFMPRYNANLEKMNKGYYVEFLSYLGHTIKNLGKNVPYTNPAQMTAIRKVLAEALLVYLFSGIIIPLVFGYDDDDENRFEKLRQKSGALPLFGVDEKNGHPFRLKGWVSNHLLNLAIQVRNENQAWLPLPGLGLDDYNSMLKLEAAALKNTISGYVRITESAINSITGDPKAYYKKPVGPYMWQQEEGMKILNNAMKMFAITGTTVQPIQGIKGAETAEIFKQR